MRGRWGSPAAAAPLGLRVPTHRWNQEAGGWPQDSRAGTPHLPGPPHTLLPARGASHSLVSTEPRVSEVPQPAHSIWWAPSRPRFPAGRLGRCGHWWAGIPQLEGVSGSRWPTDEPAVTATGQGALSRDVFLTRTFEDPSPRPPGGKGEATTSEISSPTGHALLSQTGPDSSPLWSYPPAQLMGIITVQCPVPEHRPGTEIWLPFFLAFSFERCGWHRTRWDRGYE